MVPHDWQERRTAGSTRVMRVVIADDEAPQGAPAWCLVIAKNEEPQGAPA